ncbi:MAG TPA: hypothetical protein VNE58_07560 [Casimicrobiaceae bacterium]|nr:hypothetical protein [Casimicrobiaceae bacterium]
MSTVGSVCRASVTTPAWRAAVTQALNAFTAWRTERERRRLDGHYRRERSAHERFLENARDPYELERLERDWERRDADIWRVY